MSSEKEVVKEIPDISEMLQKFGGYAGYLRNVSAYALRGTIPSGCDHWDWDAIAIQHFQPDCAIAIALWKLAHEGATVFEGLQ